MAEAAIVTTSPLRRLGTQLAVGAVLGFAGWGFVGPGIIAWRYELPTKDALVRNLVQAALGDFVVMQLVCAAIGGALAVVVAFLVRRAMKQRAQRKASAGAA